MEWIFIESLMHGVEQWDFINSLPEGINTEIGDRGIRLSGGQRRLLWKP